MAQRYQRLEHGFIRLLSFSDGSGLSCTMQPFKLAEAPAYIALSYTWGAASYQKGRPSSQTYWISLNDERVQVQQNLHDALRHLGHVVREAERLFWVDAICINQEDVQEKTAQVKMMKDIYEHADHIFAWLGVPLDEQETKLAVKMMRDFSLYIAEGLKDNEDMGAILAAITKSHAAFPADRTSSVWSAWEGIAEMLSQSYWRRVWVYQEATTPGDIHFFCGDHSFDDSLLSATVAFGMALSKTPDFATEYIEATGQASNAARLLWSRIARKEGKSRQLIELMVEIRTVTCTDQRDKVYAPLGHAADVAPSQISVDYHRDLVDVYIDVARFALLHPRMLGLEFLGLVFTPAADSSHQILSAEAEPRVPSWVPDWRLQVDISRLVDSSDATENGQSLYNACPGTELKARIRRLELEVRGHVADHLDIDLLTRIWDDTGGSPTTPRVWYDTLMAMDPANTGLDKAIRRSLVGDKSHAVEGSKENGFTAIWRRGGMLDWTLLDSTRDDLDIMSLESL